MRESTRATTWTCDGCSVKTVRDDPNQEIPPSGWRIVHILTAFPNLALQGDVVKKLHLCETCMTNVPGFP